MSDHEKKRHLPPPPPGGERGGERRPRRPEGDRYSPSFANWAEKGKEYICRGCPNLLLMEKGKKLDSLETPRRGILPSHLLKEREELAAFGAKGGDFLCSLLS